MWLDLQNIKDLQPGMIVRGSLSGESYVVVANYGDSVTAVRTVDITNPDEWKVLDHDNREALDKIKKTA